MAAAPASNQRPPARNPTAGWTELRCDSVCPRSGHMAGGQSGSVRTFPATATQWPGRPPPARFTPFANPRWVGRVTPCAPRPPPVGPGFSQIQPANPVVPMVFPPGSLIGTPHFGFATVPSRLVKPNPTKSTNFAPAHFNPDPARLDACPACRARREELGDRASPGIPRY